MNKLESKPRLESQTEKLAELLLFRQDRLQRTSADRKFINWSSETPSVLTNHRIVVSCLFEMVGSRRLTPRSAVFDL